VWHATWLNRSKSRWNICASSVEIALYFLEELMETILQDVRYGVRMLAKHPGFMAVAVIALGLGIGANTAIFSVINSVLVRPLPFANSDRLVMIWQSSPQENSFREAVAAANFLDWKDQNTAFEHLAAFREDNFNITGTDRPEQVPGCRTNASLFQVLGVEPLLGRAFQDDENAPPSVVISKGLWERLFAADPHIIGQKLIVNSEPLTITGVMPAGFDFPEGNNLWVRSRYRVPENPLDLSKDPSAERGHQYFSVVALLKPNVEIEQAQAEMDTISRRLEQQYPNDNMGRSASLISLREEEVGEVRPILLVLFGAVGFVLLIVCANVANLLMARAATRQKEIAIRIALGAGRRRIAQQLLTESVMLALAGGSAGLLVALWGISPLVALIPADIHGMQNIGVDARVLGFTMLVSLLTGVVFGLLPALGASKTDLNESLKESGRSSTEGRRGSSLRASLIVSEIAMSLVLLIGAGLMIKSFVRLQQVDLGFATENLLTMRLTLPQSKYPEKRDQARFFQQALQQIQIAPGVESAAAISRLPLTPGNSSRSFNIEGRSSDNTETDASADYRVISSDYFRTMSIPVLKGRAFTERDNDKVAGSVIINDTAARRYWPDEEPVGKRLQVEGDEWLEIVGVVGDVKHLGRDSKSRAEIYMPYLRKPWPFMTIVARSSQNVTSLGETLREAVLAVDHDQPVYNIGTVEQLVSRSVARRRSNMLLLGIFAVLAMVIAAVGIYGVMSYSITQRKHEIGIRIALGASRRDILRMILGYGLTLALAGVAAGSVAALILTRLIKNLLFDVSATDPATFLLISLALIGVALAACAVPARRALKVDPMIALRYE
jgi:putative ABC transport system permease protein